MGLKQLVPRPVRFALRRARFAAADLADMARGRRDPLTPPRYLSFVYGGGDFRRNGAELLRGAVRAGLTPASRVLDVGSGIGRFAVPLTSHLDAAQGASYDGIDIIRAGVEWCRTTITPRHPNFRFAHVDLFNKEYNPGGKLDSRTFRFPYPDGSFDFVFLGSVFTHMLPDEIDHYLAEIARVTVPGARAYITWLLRTPESLAGVAAGKARHDVRHERGIYSIMDPEVPEAAIAFDEAWVRERYAAHGFRLADPIRYGTWSGGRPDGEGHQDAIVAERV